MCKASLSGGGVRGGLSDAFLEMAIGTEDKDI